LRKKGVNVMELGKKGWTISEETVDAVLEQAAITADQDYILVLQCLDKGISLKWTVQETVSGLRRDLMERYTLQVGSHLQGSSAGDPIDQLDPC
jgi:hypothetical protein